MSTQLTLTGAETEAERERPDTFVECDGCGAVLLRRERFGHPHEVDEPAPDTDDETDTDDDPERVGSVYDVTLEYTRTYRFRVPAWNERQAQDRAEDLQLDARPADSYLLHSEEREVREVMSDDPKLPDDFDVYGNTPLWEVYGDADE